MYLVHIRLLPPPGAVPWPEDLVALMSRDQGPDVDNRIEHVSPHPHARPHPVVGVYVQASTLRAAEAATERAWHRAVLAHPPLGAWTVLSVEAPLLRRHLDD
ncbi:hypothetical protein ABT160_08125 [Streptomyces sp. NPDC001941]|uniref:hypothetical protein n=1 Tax=Streptomyces sp. NPDC001941 TaxID=3154659 RepID=UPI0033344E3F